MQDVRRALGTDVGGTVAERPAADFEDAVWSCTNCYACEQACPARIRHVDYVLDFRRALVDENRLDEQKSGVLQALDRNSNPYRLPSHERAAVAHGAAVRRGDHLRRGGARGAARVPLLDRLRRRLRRALERSGARDHGPAPRRRRELRHARTGGALLRRAGEAPGRRGPLPDARHDRHRDDQGDRRAQDRHALPARPQHLPVRVPGAGVHDPGRASRRAARRAGRRRPAGPRRPAAAGAVAYHEPCNLARAGRPAAAALGAARRAARPAAALRRAHVLLRRRRRQQLLPGRAGGDAHQRPPVRGAGRDRRRAGRGELPALPDHAARRGRLPRAERGRRWSTSPRSSRTGWRRTHRRAGPHDGRICGD